MNRNVCYYSSVLEIFKKESVHFLYTVGVDDHLLVSHNDENNELRNGNDCSDSESE